MLRSLLILMLVGFMVAVGFYYDSQATRQPDAMRDMIRGAAVIEPSADQAEPVSGVDLSALDRTTRPQDDFYQFVNGGWLDQTAIPEIYSGYTIYHQVNEEAEQALRRIVEQAAANPGAPGSESQQVGDIYNSWMDQAAVDAAGIAPVRSELERIASIRDRRGLVEVMGELSRLGVLVPYRLFIYGDLRDSARYAVYFDQSGLTMPNRDYYIEIDNPNFTAARDALPAYMADMLEISGLDAETAEAAAQKVFAIEDRLARAQWDAVDNRDPEKVYNPYPVAELARLGTNLDWSLTRETLGLDAADKLVIRQPSYFKALDRMIAETPLQDWKHYLRFRVLDTFGDSLDQATAEVRFAYRNRVLYGQQQERPRWKRGIGMVNTMVGEAVGKLYVQQHFPPEAKARVRELVGNVIATLDASLGELDWMSPRTRLMARDKLSRFDAKIGYPDEWRDYSGLEIAAGDHLGNLKRATEWEHRRQVGRIGKEVDRIEWFMTPQTVNAYYSPTKNEIVFPAARLQPPFFQLDADDAINYGAVGGVIGHEISHGFDDAGSKYDGDGNLRNWWTEADRAAFEERTRALVAQFNEFEPVEGMHVNGELTLGENIGDLSGVTMAYRAYIESLDGEEPPVLDGFTGPQRFFIGYAMSRKGKYQQEAEISRLASDPHSPLKYRVIGPYRNIDAFHEAFGTGEGDGMWLAPEDRVRLW
jgi:predicted metalloendopeptidase